MSATSMKRLVRAIAQNPYEYHVIQGAVVAVNQGVGGTQTCDVTVAGSAVTIPAVPYDLGATPAVGEGVWMLSDGRDLWIFASLSGSSAIPIVGGVGYSAGFGDKGGGFTTGGYSVDASGRTCLQGTIRTSAIATAPKLIFTLPVGFRPAAACNFVIWVATGVFAYIQIATTGTVTLETSLANAIDFSIDNIEFIAGN